MGCSAQSPSPACSTRLSRASVLPRTRASRCTSTTRYIRRTRSSAWQRLHGATCTLSGLTGTTTAERTTGTSLPLPGRVLSQRRRRQLSLRRSGSPPIGTEGEGAQPSPLSEAPAIGDSSRKRPLKLARHPPSVRGLSAGARLSNSKRSSRLAGVHNLYGWGHQPLKRSYGTKAPLAWGEPQSKQVLNRAGRIRKGAEKDY